MILLDQAGAGSNAARFFPPSRALGPFVEHFWVQKVRSSPAGRAWRVVPDANPYLIFVVSREDSRIRARCNLVGPRSRFGDTATANRVLTMGVRLRPGVLPLLTRFPASDFTDRSVAIENVFGARGRSLMERLGDLPFPLPAVGLISDFLFRECSVRNGTVPLPLGQCVRVDEMARQSGWPLRTLHSRLMQQVGLSPKRVLRIERLHRALANFQNAAWAQVAAFSGFADQAHMIREFHDLLGESPTLWSERSRLPISSRQ